MFRRIRVACAAAVLSGILTYAADATAQVESTGRVVRDNSIIWHADAAAAAITVREGTTLSITAQSSLWYEVVIPNGQGERGLIAKGQVRLIPGSPEPVARVLRGDPPPTDAQRLPPREGAAGPSSRRPTVASPDTRPVPQGARRRVLFPVFVDANASYQLTSSDFSERVTFRENVEDGHFDTSYTVNGSRGLAIGGGGMFSQMLGVGGGLSRSSQRTPAALTGEIPHPFFFNTPRSISGDVPSLSREVLALHTYLRVRIPSGTRITLAVFGGPSIFRLKQDVVETVTSAEVYPYDEATFRTATVVTVRKSTVGFNAGGDAAFFLTRQIGIGVSVTFSRVSVIMPIEDGRTAQARVGGVSTLSGLRLRF